MTFFLQLPQVYLRGHFLGFAADICDMHGSGELRDILEREGVIEPMTENDPEPSDHHRHYTYQNPTLADEKDTDTYMSPPPNPSDDVVNVPVHDHTHSHAHRHGKGHKGHGHHYHHGPKSHAIAPATLETLLVPLHLMADPAGAQAGHKLPPCP